MTDSRSARRATGNLGPRTDGVRPRKLPARVHASTQTHSETSASGTLSEGTLEAPAGNQKTDERLATNSRTSSQQVDPQRCTAPGSHPQERTTLAGKRECSGTLAEDVLKHVWLGPLCRTVLETLGLEVYVNCRVHSCSITESRTHEKRTTCTELATEFGHPMMWTTTMHVKI